MPTALKPARALRMLALAAGIAVAAAAPAAQPAGYVPREQRNGAMKYWEAWATLSPELSKKISDIEWDDLKQATDWDKMPDSFKALADEPIDSIANAIENASAYPRCNFELQWEDGVLTLMPHLSKMRSGARLMRVAARIDLVKGRPDAAAHRAAVILKTARDTAQDPVLISSLVGIAMSDLAMSEIEFQADSGKLTGKGKSELLTALRAVNTPDPMNTRASIRGERDAFVPWIEKQFSDPESLKKLRELTSLESGVKKEDADAYFDKLDAQTFHKDIKRLEDAYAELLVIWDKNGTREELNEFSKKVDTGEFGTLARYFLPTIGNAKAAHDKFKQRLAATITKVENTPEAK